MSWERSDYKVTKKMQEKRNRKKLKRDCRRAEWMHLINDKSDSSAAHCIHCYMTVVSDVIWYWFVRMYACSLYYSFLTTLAFGRDWSTAAAAAAATLHISSVINPRVSSDRPTIAWKLFHILVISFAFDGACYFVFHSIRALVHTDFQHAFSIISFL